MPPAPSGPGGCTHQNRKGKFCRNVQVETSGLCRKHAQAGDQAYFSADDNDDERPQADTPVTFADFGQFKTLLQNTFAKVEESMISLESRMSRVEQQRPGEESRSNRASRGTSAPVGQTQTSSNTSFKKEVTTFGFLESLTKEFENQNIGRWSYVPRSLRPNDIRCLLDWPSLALYPSSFKELFFNNLETHLAGCELSIDSITVLTRTIDEEEFHDLAQRAADRLVYFLVRQHYNKDLSKGFYRLYRG